MAAALVHCKLVRCVSDQGRGPNCFVVYSVFCVGRLSHVGAVSHYALGRNFPIICDLSTVSLIRTWARETRTWSTELIVVNQLQNVTCFVSLQYFLLAEIPLSLFVCLFLFWSRWVFLFLFFFSVCLFPLHLRDICFYFTYCLEVRPVFTEPGPA